MDNFQDTELLTEFVAESLQGLGSVEQDLMSLENDGGKDTALVNRKRTPEPVVSASARF